MIPITEHTDKTEQQYKKIWDDLKTKLTNRGYMRNHPSIHNCTDNLKITHGYANTQYSGTLKPDLNDLTALEIAMICDGGYSWFGGDCSKNGLKFNVKVYTD